MTHEEALQALTAWLDATQDEPLETMAGFFDARIDSYEAHMSPWERHYPWMASLLPSSVQTLLDLGCSSGLELDAIFARFPDLQVTGIDLSAPMLARLKQKHPDKRLALVQGDYFALDLGGRFTMRWFPSRRCTTSLPPRKPGYSVKSIGA